MRHGSLLLLLALLNLSTAAAQSAPNPHREEVLAYKLTLPKAHSLLTATREITRYAMGLPDFQQRAVKLMTMTPAQQQAELENEPQVTRILKENGLTAKEYMVGGPALRMALMAAAGSSSPNVFYSPENLAFAKRHQAVLQPRSDSIEALMKRPPTK